MNDERLNAGFMKLNEALVDLLEVKNEVGVDMAGKVYKAIRAYEKHIEKMLKKKD